MTVRLRYTGALPTSFMTGSVGEVGPGGEFDVPDGLEASFLQRADVELASGEDAGPAETSGAESGDGEPETRSRARGRRTAAQDEDPPAA